MVFVQAGADTSTETAEDTDAEQACGRIIADWHASDILLPRVLMSSGVLRASVVSLSLQFQRGPKAGIFLVGHRAADAERLLAQLAIDHGVRKT